MVREIKGLKFRESQFIRPEEAHQIRYDMEVQNKTERELAIRLAPSREHKGLQNSFGKMSILVLQIYEEEQEDIDTGGRKMRGREIWDNPETRRKWAEEMLWDIAKIVSVEYDDLPKAIKLSLARHPKRGTLITEKAVEVRIWGPGDYYLVVPEIQVMSIEGFHEGDKVLVTIEKVQKDESAN